MEVDQDIERAVDWVRSADALLICAGAGMGVDSGLPDFRGAQGFWRAYPALEARGIRFEEMAQPTWFEKDPRLAWAFYGHRLQLYRTTKPHNGFELLRQIGMKKRRSVFVFTSNVDGQFQKAGFPEDRIVECHGSIHHFQCAAPCSRKIWTAAEEPVRISNESFRAIEPLPMCPRCGGVARPNILMFGDWSWLQERTEEQQERLRGWLESISSTGEKLVIVEIGAGSAVPTVRHTSERIASRLSARLVRINPREHEVPAGQIGLKLGAVDALNRLFPVTGG